VKWFALLICTLFFAGCTIPQHAWPNQHRDVLWTAMVAAANTPDYSANDPRMRWVVVTNLVETNPHTGQILIRRKLARSLQLPLQVEQNDERSWFFTIQLLPDQIPTITFDSVKQVMVPAQVHDEADRYFKLIDELVGNKKTTP
jgi:hypothetical protein